MVALIPSVSKQPRLARRQQIVEVEGRNKSKELQTLLRVLTNSNTSCCCSAVVLQRVPQIYKPCP
eukprot:18491-Heterococcus_DN1.PRE.2